MSVSIIRPTGLKDTRSTKMPVVGDTVNIISVDLAFSQDHPAIFVGSFALNADKKHLPKIEVPLVARLPKKMRYPDQAQHFLRTIEAMPEGTKTYFLCDHLGPGRPVLQEMEPRIPCPYAGVSFSAGKRPNRIEGNYWSTPKDLCYFTMHGAFEDQRIKLRPDPTLEVLKQEVMALEINLRPSGSYQIHVPEGRGHDDMLDAMAVGIWWAHHLQAHVAPGVRAVAPSGGRTPIPGGAVRGANGEWRSTTRSGSLAAAAAHYTPHGQKGHNR